MKEKENNPGGKGRGGRGVGHRLAIILSCLQFEKPPKIWRKFLVPVTFM